MSSDALRRLEIQLEVHKNSLHERAQRINELEARNNDLEAEVRLLREEATKQQPQSKEDKLESAAQANKKRRESDCGPEPDREPKRHRSNPQEVVQPSNSYHGVDSGRYDGTDVRGVDRVKNGTSGSPVRQTHQTPRNLPQPPEPAQEPAVPSAPGASHGEESSLRYRPRVNPSEPWHPVDDAGEESDSSYRPEDEDDDLPVHASRRARVPSPIPAIAARLASVEPFNYGVVSEEFLSSTAERQTLGRRLDCNVHGTVVRSHDGRNSILFPTRKQHPYAPAVQGAPGLFFSAIVEEWMHEGARQVCVGIVPAKFKYMGEYTLEKMDPLEPEEFKSLPRGTKSNWGTSILKQKRYREIRKRVLRKRIYGRSLDAQDIITAYEDGDEKLYVWRMKCIGYDHNFLSRATGHGPEMGHYTGI